MRPLYNSESLCILSTILKCATRSQTWSNLGTKNNRMTQEEVQMMCIDNNVFIACNNNGHSFIESYLNAFGVTDLTSFLTALKWTHSILTADIAELKTLYSTDNRSTYSEQEIATLNNFKFPSNLTKTTPQDVKTYIKNCVGLTVQENRRKNITAFNPNNRNGWQTRAFQQLLGVYIPSRVTVKNYPYNPNCSLPPTGVFNLVKTNNIVDVIHPLNIISDSGTSHAELKLLSYLCKLVFSAKVLPGKKVYLGGSKGACKKCTAWIETYKRWLYDHHEVKLILPKNDNRPSATPVVWENPYISIKDDLRIKNLVLALFK